MTRILIDIDRDEGFFTDGHRSIIVVHSCNAVTGLATFSARIVIYLILIRRAGTSL